MKINVLHLIEGARNARGIAVIIDVFRAMTVEAYLAKNNAEKIIPTASVEYAFAYKEKHPKTVLCGERGGVIIDGFDFGNSPSAIEKEDFTGKTVVHTTSAGTQGIANAIYADEIIGGSLVTAQAVASYIKSKNPSEVSLVCMGLMSERKTEEDTLCAEYIKSLLLGKPLPDIAERIESLKTTSGAKFFDEKFKDVFPKRDFALCVSLNSLPFVMRFKKGENGQPDCMERIDVNIK